MDDVSSPSVAVKLAQNAIDIDPKDILKHPLCGGRFEKKNAKKPKGTNPGEPSRSADEVMLEFWNTNIQHKRAGEIITYKGSKIYNKDRLKALDAESAVPVDRLE